MRNTLPACILLMVCAFFNTGADQKTSRSAALDAAKVFERAIRDADVVTLLVFDPHSRHKKKSPGDRIYRDPDDYGSWQIVKELKIEDRVKQELLGTSLRTGIEHFHGGIPNCFAPRHGIRVSVGGQEVTLMICFQCSQAMVEGYRDCPAFLIEADSALVWDQVFRDVGLKTIE